MKRLRILNLIGCSCFIAYGLMLEHPSWPIVVTNGAIVIINAYYLIPKKAV